ncbi:hypothetical protein F2Q70_00020010 [Brassica cretica]|uniref:Cation efflux protein cytoplasmic domain-containing protein n=1 Tax=Brassica cretica TaxID=69181 RepID=A0A8S9GNW4_BRACR|nr:hypothetical protein F2Q70_00020010 [Brassica cretica]
MESIHETSFASGTPTEEEMKKVAKSERLAVHISNATNLVLLVAKVYASMESRSMAVIASTLDSLLDLLSGFILWFTASAMRKPNHFSLSYWQTTYATCDITQYQQGIIVFASVMATIGLQVLLEGAMDNRDHGLCHQSEVPTHALLQRKGRKVSECHKKQERLLEGFNEMESIHETSFASGTPTEEEMKKLAKSERLAVHISNATNLVLFIAKVYASMESRSMAVIASTLDSLLDLLSGFILWFTANAMRKPNHYSLSYWQTTYATCGMESLCLLPDGYSWTTSFARVRKATSLQVITQFFLLLKTAIHMNSTEEQWMIGIMASVTRVKFLLMLYCRGFQNVIVRAYAQDHLFDVVSLRTYTFGSHYSVEVDIVLPEDMRLQEAHNIGETQEMLEQLVEVERAFVHIDFEFTHLPEHKY